MVLPSFYDATWIWTLNVSMGWIRHVANAPEIPPMTKGAIKLSKLDELTQLNEYGNELDDALLFMV